MIADLVPDGVHACEVFGDAGPESAVELFPAEEAVVDGVFDERRKEFTTVRGCARTALARLGETPEPLVPGPMGAPGWPAGVVGSMTHCRGYRAAAVAHAADFAAIGIDAEPQEPLPGVVAARAVTDAERRLLRQDFPMAAELPLDRLVFCAKEASYKAFSAWLGTRFGFRDFTVRLRADGTFRCVPPGVAMPRSLRCAEGFPGRWTARSGMVLTVVVLAAHADAEF
ncbi:4'-phosphopantetheinyl transferase superfamily protein [Streptomyces sp. NPDC006208]|uniref:4'-phosphopantetheinyl transferase family protein n=1 Tax=Streptomyces sp. NPDC006208 TaxID=3156734 RepID=UPI0033A2AB40